MYMIGAVIYGVPITKRMEEAACEIVEDIHYLAEQEDPLFEIDYHGSKDGVSGFCGVQIGGFDVIDDIFVGNEEETKGDVSFNVTDEQKAEAMAKIDRLPDAIKAVLPKIGVWIVWSTS